MFFTFFLNLEFNVQARLQAFYTDGKLLRFICFPGLIMGFCLITQWTEILLQLEFELLED